jgi:hypothetical protein
MTQWQFPRADLEVGGGKVQVVTNLSFKAENGAQTEVTFRGSGTSFGAVKGDGSFDYKVAANIPNSAPERRVIRAVLKKELKQLVFKMPGGDRIIYDGAYGSVDIKSAVEGAVEGTVNFVGTVTIVEATA